jgi:hypothetical protein
MKQKVRIRNLEDCAYRMNLSTWDEKGMKKQSIVFIPASSQLPDGELGVTEVPKTVWNKIKEDPRIARRLGKELIEL